VSGVDDCKGCDPLFTDDTRFFVRVDKVLRRSLGVSETAPTDTSVEPAPPVDPEVPEEDEEGAEEPPRMVLPDNLKGKLSMTMEELGDDKEILRDEL
jgi:heat shock protein beta